MASASTAQGLIVTTHCQTTAALEEVIDCCGWPVLWQATSLRFRRQAMLIAPKISLFWLDAHSDLTVAAQLLTWMETHERLVQRIVVAYRMSSDVEVVVRGAGTHLYLAADDNISALNRGLDSTPAAQQSPTRTCCWAVSLATA